MNRLPPTLDRFFTILFLALLASCGGGEPATDQANETPQEALTEALPEAFADPLVSTEWLSEHLDAPDLVVLDCTVLVEIDESGGMRTVNGRDHFNEGHIPGAGFADLMVDLADTESPHQYAVPTPERFVAAMEALGVGDDTRVVLYDDNRTVWASRVWWMLRWVGFDRAAILDGGLGAWRDEGRPLSTEAPQPEPGTLTIHLRPELIADQAEVFAAVDDESVGLIDALPEAHFRGEMQLYARPGHIPGAVNIPSSALTDESGRFRPLDELAEVMTIDPGMRQIAYCGGGISASANAFVMARLGYPDVAVYTASLQEWAANDGNPLVTGGG